MLRGSDNKVGLLASGNLLIAGVDRLWEISAPVLNFLAVLGQVAVAAFTVYYIWKKTKQIGKSAADEKTDSTL